MAEVNWIAALIGGMLIGLSATILLAFDGRIAGISGIVNGAMKFKPEESWRWLFMALSRDTCKIVPHLPLTFALTEFQDR